MNVYRSSTTMQMDAKYNAVKQSRCMTRVITAVRSPINKTVSSRCDPKLRLKLWLRSQAALWVDELATARYKLESGTFISRATLSQVAPGFTRSF